MYKRQTRLRAAEDKLADFKKKNVGAMPTEQGGYFARLQSEMDAVKTAQTALSVAMSRREELNRQLNGESPLTAAASPGWVPGAQGAAAGQGLSLIHI